MKLAEPAPAKVNLCLFLGPRRDDGRHELVTVFESLSLSDELELSLGAGPADEVVCPEVEAPNLAAHALAALREEGWDAPAVRIEIAKRIPIAAGLGGGSADAAAALRLAHRVLPIAGDVAERVARGLGADVPAQLLPGVSLGTGAGERVEPLAPPEAHAFAIVPLPHRLATAEVYGRADELGLGRSREELSALASELRQRPLARRLVNDLEPAAVSLCPEIAGALAALRSAGAETALVCGSGPTVAGAWWGEQARQRAARAVEELRPRYPGAVGVEPIPIVGHNWPPR